MDSRFRGNDSNRRLSFLCKQESRSLAPGLNRGCKNIVTMKYEEDTPDRYCGVVLVLFFFNACYTDGSRCKIGYDTDTGTEERSFGGDGIK
ncbi:hypothetical protein MBAV_001176 [Candidatus Magnetobacterium bavaricum]|uniref:Uncharacterized protein n=1 Tax=Candidatus Magnetobacterium bavaricum TaxID=29290 RepID=A0A0F3GXB2_9BACT|nr:hypothetical protein MBAV_001176 [Candidatus Magnetobacterium bavaricum]